MEQRAPGDVDGRQWPETGRGGRVDRWRARTPTALLPVSARLLGTAFQLSSRRREHAHRQMTALCGAVRTPQEIEGLARRYLRYAAWRSESRRHPEHENDLEVVGIEHLAQFAARSEPAIMSFVHHGPWDGGIASLVRAGAPMSVIASTDMASEGGARHTHDVRRKALSTGGYLFDVREGLRGIEERLRAGRIVGVAADAHGTAEVSLLGRRVQCAPGASFASWRLGVPIVAYSCVRPASGGRPHVVVHPPLVPTDFPDRESLHQAVLRAHEPAVAAWPEAYEDPTHRLRFVG